MTDFNYNRNEIDRDAIIFGNDLPKANYRVAYFQHLSIEKLEQLLENKFANPDEGDEIGMPIEKYLYTAKRWKSKQKDLSVSFAGYVLPPSFEDYRLTVHSMCVKTNQEFSKEFLWDLLYFLSVYKPSYFSPDYKEIFITWE